MPVIEDLGLAQPGLCKVCELAGSRNGKEGQIGVAWHVDHLACQASHAQVVCACGLKNVRRNYARIGPSPGYDGTDHAAGAACDELVTGLDHSL